MEVDLFGSAWNARLPKFVSWLPQPGGWRTDALTIHWRDLQGYAFPPFSLIPHCLSKIIRDQAPIVPIVPIVTHYWPSQAWFPTLLELASDCPRLFHPIPSLLTSPLGECHPLTMDGSIRLIGWKLSGIACEVEIFRNRFSTLCWQQPELIHTLHTRQPGHLGMIRAVEGMLIPCRLA